MTETRRSRLANDYRELKSMEGPLLTVRPLSGIAPYFDEYELTIRIRSIIGPAPTYRGIHVIRLSFPAGYPNEDYPRAVMVTKPYPYHTNWFPSGRWCYGSNSLCTEGAGNYVVRLMQTLQFRHEIIDTQSAANGEAASWYIQNKRVKGLFPSDTQKLPQPSVDGMIIKKVTRS